MPSYSGFFQKPVLRQTRQEQQRIEKAQSRRLLDRAQAALGKTQEALKARELAEGLRKVAQQGTGLAERVAAEVAKRIEERPKLTKAVEKILAGLSKPPTRVQLDVAERALRDRYRNLMRGAAERLAAGKIDPGEFRRQMGRYIRQLQPEAALIGAGGVLTEGQQKLIERSIKDQIAYLDGFVRDVKQRLAEGKPLGGRDVMRAGMYAGAARATAEQALRQAQLDLAEEKGIDLCEVRMLGAAEHCEDCLEFAYRPGPVGTLPPIGDSRCGHNCQCHFEFGPCDELYEKYGGRFSE